MKVVYNDDFGGFILSGKALERYCELKGIPVPKYPLHDVKQRHDPALVQVVEELHPSVLAIRDIPSGSLYRIDEYDGNESVKLIQEYDWIKAVESSN